MVAPTIKKMTDGCAAVISPKPSPLGKGDRLRWMRFRGANKFCLPAEGGGTSLASDGRSCVHKGLRCFAEEPYGPLCTHSPSVAYATAPSRKEPFYKFEPCKKERGRMRGGTPFHTLLIHRKRSPRRLLANSTVASRHAPSQEKAPVNHAFGQQRNVRRRYKESINIKSREFLGSLLFSLVY